MAMHEVERAMLNIGIDDGMFAAALAVREKVGRKSIAGVTRGKTISLCLIAKNEETIYLSACSAPHRQLMR